METEACHVKQRQIDRLNAQLAALKLKLDRINNAFVESSLELAEFKELKNPLIEQKADLEQRLVALEKSRANRLEPMRNWVLQANQAEKWASEENWVEMKSFLKKVGSNRLLRAQTFTVSFKNPWSLLAETTVAVRSTANFSEWWRRGGLNPRPLQTYQPRLHA